MYDPTAGRWLEEDPLGFDGGTPNLYGYVSNNSTNAVDPLGLQKQLVDKNKFTTLVREDITGNQFGNWRILQVNRDGQLGLVPKKYSSDVQITFYPDPTTVRSTEIAFIQIVRILDTNGKPVFGAEDESAIERAVPDRFGAESGWHIDRRPNEPLAWFGYVGNRPGKDLKPGSAPLPLKNAWMHDKPESDQPQLVWYFETFAISKSGDDALQAYGGISWGFYVDADMKVHSLQREFLGELTKEFNNAVAGWNKQAKEGKSKNCQDQDPLPGFRPVKRPLMRPSLRPALGRP